MRGTLNAHKVFRGTVLHKGYLKALNVDDTSETALRSARDKIRSALRDGVPQWQDVAKSHGLIEQRFIALAAQLPALRPRFRMQGSGVYHTLNEPAHKPPQEVDYDDGMFLPTSFVGANGTLQPMIAARGYFKMVESILEPLCKRQGWILNRSKPTCVRIHIGNNAHIDLPLYAIPDAEFATLKEASAHSARGVANAAVDELILAEQVYKGLRKDQIMLARRDTGWSDSDPREIEDWFLQAVKEHGDAVRFVSRYLKGWRDYKWLKDGPSSIALMACVVTVFDDLGGTLPDNRDDLALQTVAARLPELFAQPIPNPVIPDQMLDEKWAPEQRKDFIAHATALRTELDGALNGTYEKGIALSRFRSVFGERLPNDQTLLSVDSDERKMLDYMPAAVAAPYVPRTKSG